MAVHRRSFLLGATALVIAKSLPEASVEALTYLPETALTNEHLIRSQIWSRDIKKALLDCEDFGKWLNIIEDSDITD